MSKRGQVFILAAILIAVILFSLAAIKNKFEQKMITGDFEILAENFQIEASKLINSVMTNPDTTPDKVHEAFKSFSTMFTSYAKGKNPKYGLIYVLGYGDKIQVTNFLDRVITIQGTNPNTGDFYSINISGGFENIPADLNFGDFNIKIGETRTGLEFPCWPLSELTPNYVVQNTYFCAFMPVSSDIEFTVIIDEAPYYLCIQRGVPELMQVSLMRQGEQAKVKGTGKCINQDFCQTFTTQHSCEETGGNGICCWWADRICISQYSYPDMCGAGATCYPTSNIFCLDDFTKYYFNTCGNPEPGGFVETCGSGEVCRDQKSGTGSTQCCKKEDKKKCSGNYVYWFNACSPPTVEGMVENCQDGVCRDDTNGLPSGKEAECCIKEDHTECYENNIYWYNKCLDSAVFVREESPDVTCSDGQVCRDSKDDSSFLTARCCLKNEEEKCFENKIYYYDGCGINQGIVTEDGDCARYCSTPTNKCCIQQTGQVCSDDLTKICDYYDDCENKADCNTDCGTGKKCECEDSSCTCKI